MIRKNGVDFDMQALLKSIKAKSGEFHYAQREAKPCVCGNLDLTLVQTTESIIIMNGKQIYPARVKIYCPKCRASGIDTCHGEETAIRRWNAFGD